MRKCLTSLFIAFSIFGASASVMAAVRTIQQTTSSDETSLEAKCQIAAPSLNAISAARVTWMMREGDVPEAHELISQTDRAARPPEYDSVGAKALADKAIQLLKEDTILTKFPENSTLSKSKEMPDDEDGSQDDSLNPLVVIGGIALVEVILEQSAKSISENPNDWGLFFALIGVPWAIAEAEAQFPESETAKWIAGGLTAALAAYYINLDEDKYNEDEIVQDSMDTWHIILVTGLRQAICLVIMKRRKKLHLLVSAH